MKKQFIFTLSSLLFCSMLAFTSCKKESSGTNPPTVADTSVVVVNFSTTSPYSFFSFKNGTVSNVDSASTKWDFGLRLTTFLVNSSASGPGNAGVIMQDGIFDNIMTAPTTGYAYDTTAGQLAIKDGSWYNYNPTTHSFLPKPGKVFIFRTADNHYAKMEILEVTYQPFTGMTPEKIDYKIRFAYQANGSANF